VPRLRGAFNKFLDNDSKSHISDSYVTFQRILPAVHCSTCACTCMLMSGEAIALNARILLPKFVESVVLESVGGR